MNDSLSEINDDIREYEALCRKFDEPIHYDKTGDEISFPDCYGRHAKKLKLKLKKHEN